jgi:hypothetical protein
VPKIPNDVSKFGVISVNLGFLDFNAEAAEKINSKTIAIKKASDIIEGVSKAIRLARAFDIVTSKRHWKTLLVKLPQFHMSLKNIGKWGALANLAN